MFSLITDTIDVSELAVSYAMRKHFISVLVWGLCAASFPITALLAEPIKIGVPTALSGDAASFGIDIKNALVLANEKLGGGRYELIFEDERCASPAAVSVANKFISVDRIRYALGFPCNATLLATAAMYDRANVLVITSPANSGDVLDVGKHIFRLFPSNNMGAELLFHYMRKRHRKIAILTEQNEYPVMMQRTVIKANEKLAKPIEILTADFVHGISDVRTVLLKLIANNVEAIFLNANDDKSFIPVVRQIRALKFEGSLYSAYLPGSATVQRELGDQVNGFIFCNLPAADDLVTPAGRELLKAFRKRFGEPSFPVVLPTAFESFRILDLAIRSGRDPVEFMHTTKFSGGFIPDYYFDEHGAVRGINFQLQKIEGEKVVVVQ